MRHVRPDIHSNLFNYLPIRFVPRLLIPAVAGGDVLYHGKNAIDERRAVLMHMRACVCVRVMRGTQPRRVSE